MVKFSHDPEANACYLYADVRPGEDTKGVVVRSETVSEEPMVTLDYREDGSLYGIEMLLPAPRQARGE